MIDHYPILYDGVILRIQGDMLKTIKEKPMPIHWDNRGLIGIIPVERVRNALSVLQDNMNRLNALEPDIDFEERLCFYWGETELYYNSQDSTDKSSPD